jgi:hypothetical protein
MKDDRTKEEAKAVLHKMGVELLNAQQRSDYEERAAIIEFDGGLTRVEAETAALKIARGDGETIQGATSRGRVK